MNKIKLLGGLVVFLLLFSSSAWATLTVTFDRSLAIGQVAFFWGGDASTANQAGRTINSDPTATLSLADGFQAKVFAAAPTDRYIFYSDASSGANQSTGIRVWDTTARAEGDHYSALASYANPWGSPASQTLAVTYPYIRAIPQQAIITRYAETGTTILSPAPSSDRSVTFTSAQTARSDGYTVELKQAEWQLTLNGRALANRLGGTTLALANSTGDSLNAGDTYQISVRYQNHWNQWGAWSDPVTYAVGAAAAGGGAAPITYVLTYEAGGLGLNSVAVLHNVPFNVNATATDVSSVSQFVSELNGSLGAGSVRAVGWVENSRIVGYIITYAGATPTYVPVGGAAADGAATLTRGQSIQLYVTTPGSVTFSQ